MRQVCAWCLRDGVEKVIRVVEGEGPDSHGICEEHLADIGREVEEERIGAS
jgi:hypothetical protein